MKRERRQSAVGTLMAAQVDPRAGPEGPMVEEMVEEMGNTGLPLAKAREVAERKPAAKRQKRDEAGVVYSSLSPDAPEHHDGTAPAWAAADCSR